MGLSNWYLTPFYFFYWKYQNLFSGQVLDRQLDNVRPDPPKANLRVTNRDDDENVPLTEHTKENETDEHEGKTYGRVQKLRNTRDAYIITVVSFGFQNLYCWSKLAAIF